MQNRCVQSLIKTINMRHLSTQNVHNFGQNTWFLPSAYAIVSRQQETKAMPPTVNDVVTQMTLAVREAWAALEALISSRRGDAK